MIICVFETGHRFSNQSASRGHSFYDSSNNIKACRLYSNYSAILLLSVGLTNIISKVYPTFAGGSLYFSHYIIYYSYWKTNCKSGGGGLVRRLTPVRQDGLAHVLFTECPWTCPFISTAVHLGALNVLVS